MMFWRPVILAWPARSWWPRWTVIPYLLLADLQNTVLAAILTLSDRVIYPAYLTVPRTGTITALEDQSVAGVIMWVPGSLVFLVAAVGVVMETLGARGQAALQGRLVEGEGLAGTQPGPRCSPAFPANAPPSVMLSAAEEPGTSRAENRG